MLHPVLERLDELGLGCEEGEPGEDREDAGQDREHEPDDAEHDEHDPRRDAAPITEQPVPVHVQLCHNWGRVHAGVAPGGA